MNALVKLGISGIALVGALGVLPGIAQAAESNRPAHAAQIARDHEHEHGRGGAWDRRDHERGHHETRWDRRDHDRDARWHREHDRDARWHRDHDRDGRWHRDHDGRR